MALRGWELGWVQGGLGLLAQVGGSAAGLQAAELGQGWKRCWAQLVAPGDLKMHVHAWTLRLKKAQILRKPLIVVWGGAFWGSMLHVALDVS